MNSPPRWSTRRRNRRGNNRRNNLEIIFNPDELNDLNLLNTRRSYKTIDNSKEQTKITNFFKKM
jgi:hypothetical protein